MLRLDSDTTDTFFIALRFVFSSFSYAASNISSDQISFLSIFCTFSDSNVENDGVLFTVIVVLHSISPFQSPRFEITNNYLIFEVSIVSYQIT